MKRDDRLLHEKKEALHLGRTYPKYWWEETPGVDTERKVRFRKGRMKRVKIVIDWLERDGWRGDFWSVRDWEVSIAAGMPMQGILGKFCKIGGNLEIFKFYKRHHNKYIRCARDPMCRRRHIYWNIAHVGELLIPYEKDLTKCFLTACKHNPYLAMRLAYYADIHAVTRTGMNAVSLAVAHGFPILAVQLIDLGVTPFKKNHRGMDAFDFVQKTYSVNKVVKYGLRRAVKRYQNRQSVHQILEIGFQDFIVAGIVMEYLPIRTQNKIKCWKNNCWKYEFHCWQCSLIDDGCPFPFEYCQVSGSGNCGNKKHCKKYYETMHFVRALQGGWRCHGR